MKPGILQDSIYEEENSYFRLAMQRFLQNLQQGDGALRHCVYERKVVRSFRRATCIIVSILVLILLVLEI